MPVVNTWVGAVHEDNAWVRAKLEPGASTVHLQVSTSPDFSAFTQFGPVSPTNDNVVSVGPSGLTPRTRYYYRWSIDGDVDSNFTGRFITAPVRGQPASFKFAAAGDAGLNPDYPGVAGTLLPERASNALAFDKIREHNPEFFIHLGDIHYYNPGQIIGATVNDMRRCIDDVLLQPRQHELYRTVPLVWSYDDHDYGPNDSDRTAASRLPGAQVYRERVPHYPLPDAEGAIYHSFQWGRVLFIITDDRFHRDPKGNPDGPEHHMLGPTQLDWIESTLRGARANGAEAVVMTTGVQWHVGGTGSDSWGGYAYERDKLTAIVENTGWADHLIMLQADAHSLAMDDGANNPYGGWPLYLLASIDANPSNVSTVYYNIGVSNAKNQYGVLDVDDDGNRITVTVSGYNGDTVLMEHSVILADVPAPPPPPPPAPVVPGGGQAEATPVISWYAYDLLTLRRLSKLRGVKGSIARALGAAESSTLEIPTPLSGPMANRLVTSQVTAPNTLIVAEINKLPAWAGIVWKTEESSEGGYALGCSTVESYLDRRYTRTMHFEQIEQVDIMRSLAARAADDVGIPLEFDITSTGIRRDRHYYDDEDATLYQRIQELSEVINGPEWTIRAEYADEFGSQLRLIFTCRAVIGDGRDNPKGPISTKGRAKARWKLTHDWSKGNGANAIIATSSQSEGEERPQSVELMDMRGDHPKIEYRFSPSSSITEVTTLNDHADAELTAISRGTESIEITARWDQAPVRLGLDVDNGDWLEYRLHGPTRPAGLVGVKRMIAWKLDTNNGTFSPTLLED